MSEQDEYIAFCLECGNEQPDSYIENSPFYQQNSSTPCKYCHGVTAIAKRSEKENALRRDRQRRGIS